MREILLDTETTGLDPQNGHRIVEIGALEMKNKVLTGRTFHYYINPERDMPDEAYRIHGISGEFLKTKPIFHKIVDEFLEFISDSPLVIHNAIFDMKFINYELSLLKYASLDINNTIDTLLIARKLFPGQRVNLDALCKRYDIDNSNRQFHGALKDAKLLADVYVELTGGRQEIFSMVYKNNVANKDMNLISSIIDNNFKVIYADPVELEKHREFCRKNGLINSWYD